MAVSTTPAPNGAPTKAKRKTGPRTVKPVQGILLYKGTIEGDVKVVFDPMEALDAKEADASLQMRKFTVPRKGKPAAPAAPSA